MKKDYSFLLIQLDRKLASEDDQSIWSKRRKLSPYQVESNEPNNLSSCIQIQKEVKLLPPTCVTDSQPDRRQTTQVCVGAPFDVIRQ